MSNTRSESEENQLSHPCQADKKRKKENNKSYSHKLDQKKGIYFNTKSVKISLSFHLFLL